MKKLGIVLLTLLVLFCFTVTTFAVDFTPSVEQKDAPSFVKVTDSEGNECDALIVDEVGNETPIISNSELQIVITPYSKKEEAIVTEITGYLDGAQYQIAAAENLSDLTETMVDALELAKSKTTDPVLKEVSLDDLIVRDLFDVSLVRDELYVEPLKEGETITFAIQTDLKPGDMYFILINCYGDEWKVVTNLQLDENGVLTITVDSLCGIALVTHRLPEKVIDPNAPTSPQTGEASGMLTGAILFGAAAILLLACAARRKQTER